MNNPEASWPLKEIEELASQSWTLMTVRRRGPTYEVRLLTKSNLNAITAWIAESPHCKLVRGFEDRLELWTGSVFRFAEFGDFILRNNSNGLFYRVKPSTYKSLYEEV